MFFDALGVRWEYEKEGYDLGNAGWYLPDFWLPGQQTWVEVKGQDPGKGSAEYQKAEKLTLTSGQLMRMVFGDPLTNRGRTWRTANYGSGLQCYSTECEIAWCVICREVVNDHRSSWHGCGSTGVLNGWTVQTAKALARSARFEHGAVIQMPARPLRQSSLYLAGKIHQENGEYESNDDWRSQLFPDVDDKEIGEKFGGHRQGYTFGGPDLTKDHGNYDHGLARDCLQLVLNSDVVFAWITTEATHGTFAELGAAWADRKPTFVAYPNFDLAHELWFARGLATEWCVADSVVAAFRAFEEWWMSIA